MPRRLSPWVFTSITGKQLAKGSANYVWSKVALAAGRKDMDVYELRHFCATHLLQLELTRKT
jgi:site-specific recombinase XerD